MLPKHVVVIVALLASINLSGCFGGEGGADGAADGNEQTRPVGLRYQPAALEFVSEFEPGTPEWSELMCDPPIEDPDADPDRDGLTNRDEAWWATNPQDPDTDGDGVSDGAEVRAKTPMFDALGPRDWDGDALPDGAESCVIGTDPASFSTDGDFYGDGLEYFGTTLVTQVYAPGGDTWTRYGRVRDMPGYIERDPFQPAVPEVIVRVDEPVLFVETKVSNLRTDTDGTTDTNTNQGSTTTTATYAKEWKFNSHAGFTATAWGEAKAGVATKGGWPPWKNEVKATASLEIGARAELSAQVSHAYEDASRDEWQQQRQHLHLYETQHQELTQREVKVDFAEAKLFANLEIDNVGNDVLRDYIDEIVVNFYVGSERWYTWLWSQEKEAGRVVNLDPEDPPLAFAIDADIPSDIALEIMDGATISAAVEHVSYGLDDLTLMNVRARTVHLTVDDGEGGIQVHNVAVSPAGTSLEKLYNGGIGTMVVEGQGDLRRIVSIDGRSTASSAAPYTYWTIVVQPADEPSPSEVPAVIADLTVHPGDEVFLRFDRDSDGDLLVDAAERLFGTQLDEAHSDDDGLMDGEEVFGLRFGQEADAPMFHELVTMMTRSHSTNPLDTDTDDDGINDKDDSDPLSILDRVDEILAVEYNEPGTADDRCVVFGVDSATPPDPASTGFQGCTGTWPWSFKAADVDFDGRSDILDVLATSHEWCRLANWDYEDHAPCFDVTCRVSMSSAAPAWSPGTSFPCGKVAGLVDPNGEHTVWGVPVVFADLLGGPHPEILVADHAGDRCEVFSYEPELQEWRALKSMDRCAEMDRADVMLAMNTGGPQDSVVFLHTYGWCSVLNVATAALQTHECRHVGEGRHAEAGDVSGDGRDEIVVTTPEDGQCRVFRPGERSATADENVWRCGSQWKDELLVGNVIAGGKEEVIIAKHATKECQVWDADAFSATPYRLIQTIPNCYHQFGILVSDLLATATDAPEEP